MPSKALPRLIRTLCIDSRNRRQKVSGLLIVLASLSLGCAEVIPQPGSGMAEALYAAPRDRVKEAVVKVLTANGYRVDEDVSGTRLQTGYREEIDSITNWLVVSRFGITRSRVRVDLADEAPHSTMVKLEVLHDSKDGLFSSWGAGDIPLPQSPDTFLRLIKNELGLL